MRYLMMGIYRSIMNLDSKTVVSALTAVVLAAILVLGFNIDIFGQLISPPERSRPSVSTTTVEVTRVIDGDTLAVGQGTSSQSVRLIGVDAPEIDWEVSSQPEAECFGWEARDFLRSHAEGEQVQLVDDVKQPNQDGYDRRLAYVYIDSELVNKKLLAQGYARELAVGAGYGKQEAFQEIATAAREADRGLWAACE